ncbi:MAG: hypothetical protein RLZZ396_1051, partial [Planctomycetota bacterium]
MRVISAGAGSGKTTTLCRIVSESVAEGLDPAKILATTFTKKAAAELKSRVLSKLMESGHADRVDRLELAAIGTVHSVAHQLLSRYAIEMGLSPQLEVIEHGVDRILARLIQNGDPERWESLRSLAERFGFKKLTEVLQQLMSLKRGNRISDDSFRAQMRSNAERIVELVRYNQPNNSDGDSGEVAPDQLCSLAQIAIEEIQSLHDKQDNTAVAKDVLRSIIAQHFCYWGAYAKASSIKAVIPTGENAKLDPLRIHAKKVRTNPQLHRDLREFLDLLASEVIELEAKYRVYKLDRGLVDFTDLEVLFLELLQNPAILRKMQSDFDLFLVDEFQDTSPMQLAIFRRFLEFKSENVWVGDLKQSIFGFRDTDPQLIDGAWSRVPPQQRESLRDNHRTQGGLVNLFNEWFEPHFPDATQNPARDVEAKGVERWITLPPKKGRANKTHDGNALASGVIKLRAEGTRYSDIAILASVNKDIESLTDVLRDRGVPFQIESPGLFATREGLLLLSGLRLVANRNDSLAAATILHWIGNDHEENPRWLAERLTELSQAPIDPESGNRDYVTPFVNQPILSSLEKIDPASLTPSMVVLQVIESLGLAMRVQHWGQAARRCSNLDSASRHAKEFEEASLTGSGSATLTGLILYLEQLAQEGKDFCYPSAGHDAVTLLTYHGAKGLEWPVVILTGLGSLKEVDMWKPRIESVTDPINPLANREIRYWPWPFGYSENPKFPQKLSGTDLEKDILTSTEACDQSDKDQHERKRLLYVGCTRAKSKLVFTHRPGATEWLDLIPEINQCLDPGLEPGQHDLPDYPGGYVVWHFSPDDAMQAGDAEADESVYWFAQRQEPAVNLATRRYHAPSQAVGGGESETRQFELDNQQYFPEGAQADRYAAIGDSVHHYLAAIPSLEDADDEQKLRVATRCVIASGVTDLVVPEALVYAGKRFRDWVHSTYPGATWHVEVPASGTRDQGGYW